jgi:hypothetical protein
VPLQRGVAESGGWAGGSAGGEHGDTPEMTRSQSWARFLWGGGGSGNKKSGGDGGGRGGGGSGSKNAGSEGGGGNLVHRLLVASVGNSQAVLCRGGGGLFGGTHEAGLALTPGGASVSVWLHGHGPYRLSSLVVFYALLGLSTRTLHHVILQSKHQLSQYGPCNQLDTPGR